MASPRMLAQREELAHLAPRVFRLNRAVRPRTMLRGDYAGLLRQSARNANVLAHQRVAAVNAADRDGQPRAIPTGGPGRRRAKAIRNRNAANETEAARRRDATATVTVPYTRTRGRTEENGPLHADGLTLETLARAEGGETVGDRFARLLGGWRDGDEVAA